MFKRSFCLLAALLTISGCQNDASTQKSENASTADIIVRATTDLEAPAPIIEATFVPNSVATWLGYIIMINKNADLYRSTTDSQVHLIDKGNYQSVIGLARIKQPGVFLAVTKSGNLKAFIEADDEGNFKQLPISISSETRLTKFCQSAVPTASQVFAITNGNVVKGFNVEITENTSVSLGVIETGVGPTCPSLTYDQDKSIELDKATSELLISAGRTKKTISITNGLSILGLTNPGYVSVTTANMGSVYRNGVILTADKDSGRIVLIARDYFVEAVTE